MDGSVVPLAALVPPERDSVKAQKDTKGRVTLVRSPSISAAAAMDVAAAAALVDVVVAADEDEEDDELECRLCCDWSPPPLLPP